MKLRIRQFEGKSNNRRKRTLHKNRELFQYFLLDAHINTYANTSNTDRKHSRAVLRSAERRGSLPLSPPRRVRPVNPKIPLPRVSSIVMQITITNRRQGRGPLRYRGTRISSFFLSPRRATLSSLASTWPFLLGSSSPTDPRIPGERRPR